MRGDWKGKRKQEPDHASADAQARGRKPTTEAAPIDDVMLREYLLDALAPEVSARVEKRCATRQSFVRGLKMFARIAPTASCTRWERSGTAPG